MIQIKTDKIKMIIHQKTVLENMLNEFLDKLLVETHTDASIDKYEIDSNNILTVKFSTINTILFHSRKLNNTLQFDLSTYDEVDADLLYKLYKEQEREYIKKENQRKLEEFQKQDTLVLKALEDKFGPFEK